MKKIIRFCLMLGLSFSLVGCNSNDKKDVKKVVYVTAGALGDNGFSDSTARGLEKIKKEFGDKYKIFFGSAATTKNLNELMKYTFNELKSHEEDSYETYDEVYVKPTEREEGINVYVENGKFIVDGPYIEKLLRSTNFESTQSLKYFQENLRKNKVVDKLKELGVQEGQSVFIDGYEFEFVE